MNHHPEQLRNKLHDLGREWIARGLPSVEILNRTADELNTWKQSHGITGIWNPSPLMITATIDDGIGQGIEIIGRYAQVAGLRVHSLGLLQTPDHIINTCNKQRPAILGITILQLDSDEDLAHIGHNLPPETALVAGGPVFRYDPDMAQRCNVHHVSPNVTDFIHYLLDWNPGDGTTA